MARSRAVVVATFLAAAPVLVAGLLGWWFGEQRRAATATYRVVEVIDGDTIVVDRDGHTDTVRILGVDTSDWAEEHLGRPMDLSWRCRSCRERSMAISAGLIEARFRSGLR